MTFKQMLRNLERNSVRFMEEGEVVKAQTCVELMELVRSRGYENIRGKIELSGSNT